jgi:hypothetical protein
MTRSGDKSGGLSNVRNSARAAFAALAIVGCKQATFEAPGPVSLKTTHSKAQVVQLASKELTSVGFEVATSDTVAGSLTATRTRDRRGNYDFIDCDFAENSLAEQNLVSTLTVTVATTSPTTGTNSVAIGASVLAKYPGLEGSPLPRSESRSDCVSTGAIEKQIATALQKAP